MKIRKFFQYAKKLSGILCGSILLMSSNTVNAENPKGYFDFVQSDLPNQIRVRGWAFDSDNVNHKVRIHVYVGGSVGAKVPSYEVKADKYRPDVNRAFQGVGDYHGFDSTIKVDTSRTGNQTIYIYALNDVGSGTFVELGSKLVNIKGNNRVTNHNPQGQVIQVDSPRDYTLHVKGRAWDDDNPNGIVRVHVYVGGTPGSSVPQYEIRADKGNHEFEDTRNIGNSKVGNQTVHVYALNDHGPGTFQEIWSGNVNIKGNNENNYDNKVRSFINDNRFKHGAPYGNNTKPYLVAKYLGSGCNAYARDFVKYVFGVNDMYGQAKGTDYNASKIQSGDVVQINGHFFVVLYRNGENLTTAEGNWVVNGFNGRVVRYSESAYKVKNGSLKRGNATLNVIKVLHFR